MNQLTLLGWSDSYPQFHGGLRAPAPVSTFWGVVATASMLASAYHGYKRHRDSVGWAIGWGLLGGLFPILTPAVAVIFQGYAKPMKTTLKGRRK